MNTAAYYAKALYELVALHPERGNEYLKNMRHSLLQRGHEKLLPRIFSEYQKLETQKLRTDKHKEVTPKMQQTADLLDLYRALIAQ